MILNFYVCSDPLKDVKPKWYRKSCHSSCLHAFGKICTSQGTTQNYPFRKELQYGTLTLVDTYKESSDGYLRNCGQGWFHSIQ